MAGWAPGNCWPTAVERASPFLSPYPSLHSLPSTVLGSNPVRMSAFHRLTRFCRSYQKHDWRQGIAFPLPMSISHRHIPWLPKRIQVFLFFSSNSFNYSFYKEPTSFEFRLSWYLTRYFIFWYYLFCIFCIISVPSLRFRYSPKFKLSLMLLILLLGSPPVILFWNVL